MFRLLIVNGAEMQACSLTQSGSLLYDCQHVLLTHTDRLGQMSQQLSVFTLSVP